MPKKKEDDKIKRIVYSCSLSCESDCIDIIDSNELTEDKLRELFIKKNNTLPQLFKLLQGYIIKDNEINLIDKNILLDCIARYTIDNESFITYEIKK